ncbi:MAG: hypothetical protein CMM52_14085 [Rhodospirillaceae bacterium]|nr:hypothetical protein [Rhodospirillaceae bacterium]|tara:strand:+ start:35584 stop:36021 length:438 start_codon:yes stop_codon:yes gene_type:complete
MSSSSQENAMTEIALAMAMGFFSVMVLTAISMGAPVAKSSSKQSNAIPIAILAQNSTSASKGTATKITKKDLLVVYDGKTYRDRQLATLDPRQIRSAGRVILAVTPDLSMSAAMNAQKNLAAKNIVITTLDARWDQALRSKNNAQ